MFEYEHRSPILNINYALEECSKQGLIRFYAGGFIAGTPLGRFGEPEDIVPLAEFLALEDLHWITCESIRASGGVRGLDTEVFKMKGSD